MLEFYKMIVVAFLVTDKANYLKFFEETCLVANVSQEVVFKMFFLTLSDADINFFNRELC